MDRVILNAIYKSRKAICVVMAVVFVLSATITLTLVWNDVEYSEARSDNIYSAVLIKQDAVSGSGLEGAVFELYQFNGSRVGEPYTTGADGTVKIENLEQGQYYFREIYAPKGYNLGYGDNKINFTVTEDNVSGNPVQVTAKNTRKTYPLTVKKEITSENQLTDAQLSEEYTFLITLGNADDTETGYTYTINNKSGGTFYNGRTVKLKHNDTLVIHNIPYDTFYSVQETGPAGKNNFVQGNIPVNGAEVMFANAYAAGSLLIEHTVQTIDKTPLSKEQQEKAFEIKVEFANNNTEARYQWKLDDAAQTPLTSGSSIYLKHGQKAVFDNLPENMEYTLTERREEAYIQETICAKGVIVTDTKNKVSFVNVPKTQSEEAGTVTIKKQVSGKNKSFAFKLTVGDGSDTNTTYPVKVNGVAGKFKNGDTINLGSNGIAVIEKIPPGTEYTVQETGESNYAQTLISQSGQVPYKSAKSVQADFLNIQQQDKTLRISKKTTGGGADKNKRFNFTLYINNKVYEKFTLKDGEYKEYKVSCCTAYKVVEDDYTKENYSTYVDTKNGAPSGGTICAEQRNVMFVNEFTGTNQPEYTSIQGKKTWNFDGYEAIILPQNIKIHVKANDMIIADRVITADDNWSWNIKLPKYADDGKTLMQYTITEDCTEGFQTTVSGFDITNTYNPGIVYLEIPAQKIITGSPKTPDTFTFLLQAETENAPMPEGGGKNEKHVTINGAGRIDFGSITYEKEGSYQYRVSETKGTEDNYTYDSTQYIVTVEVCFAEDNITLRETVRYEKVTGSGTEVLEGISYNNPLIFSNTYTPDEPVTTEPILPTTTQAPLTTEPVTEPDTQPDTQPPIPEKASFTPAVTKQLTGNAQPKQAEVFTFKITANSNFCPVPKSNKTTVTGTGTGYFNTIEFTKEGTYAYTITEAAGSTAGYTYDAAVYTLTVTVRAGSNNRLQAVGRYQKQGFDTVYESAVFTNEYNQVPTGETVTIKGYKRWVHGGNSTSLYPKAIIVYVKDGSRIVLSKEINESTHWAWSFVLDKYDSNGKIINYTIDEAAVAGYTKKIEGYNIINTYAGNLNKQEVTTISGTVEWSHGTSGATPATVTVYVKNGSAIAAVQTVTAENGWRYHIALPKYDAYGNIIQYTVDQKHVDGYGKYIQGYNLYNSFGYSDGELPPETGQKQSVLPWASAMAVSFIIFMSMLYLGRKGKKQ